MERRFLRTRIGTSQRLLSRAPSLLKIRVAKRTLAKRTFGLKNWHPVKTIHRISSRVYENSCEPTDKSRAAGLPLWIISLDLSKVFHTVNWETLWEALRRQNISNQSIWILQCLDHNQTDVVRDGAGDSRTSDIFSSVREGCVLTPRLFCAAFELAMSEWRLANPHGRVNLGDVMPRLLDLRFADDIFIFFQNEGRGAKIVG